MSEVTHFDKDLSKLKRYLHTGFETLEKLKTGDDLKDLKCLINLIKINNGLIAVEAIRKISTEGNLNDRTYLITSLAVCARQNFDVKTKTRAYEILKDVCVNPYHLFLFLSKCELFGFLLLHNGELQLQSQESFKKENQKIDLDLKNPPIRKPSAKKQVERIPSAKAEHQAGSPTHNGQIKAAISSIQNNEQSTDSISSAKKGDQLKRATSGDKSKKSTTQDENSPKRVPSARNNPEHIPTALTHPSDQVVRILSAKKEDNQTKRIPSANKNDQQIRILSAKNDTKINLANKDNQTSGANELSKTELPQINTHSINQNTTANKTESELKLPNIVNVQKNISDQKNTNRPGFMSPTNPQLVPLEKQCLNTGWGRAHKKAINKWYESLKPLEFALFLTKYPKKFKWRHRDVFRLSHFKSKDVTHNLLIIYASRGFQASMDFYERIKDGEKKDYIIRNKKNGKETKITYDISAEARQELAITYEYLKAFESIKFLKDENKLMDCIKKFHFDIEHVLSQNKLILNSNEAISKIWIFYIKNNMVSLSQIIKSLTNLGKRGLLSDGELADFFCQKMNDQTLIKNERLHPLFLFTLFKLYSRGGNALRKFAVNPKLSASLYEMFLSSFKYIDTLDKPLAIVLNTWILSKASLYKNILVTPFQASIIMLLCSLNSQPNSKLYSLTDKMEELTIDKNMDFNLIVSKLWQSSIGSTHFSLPVISASEKNLNFDSFVIYTNLEPDINQAKVTLKALEDYRLKLKNPRARFLYVSMVASSSQIADPNDENMLDLIGFTQNSPQIILNFSKGLF